MRIEHSWGDPKTGTVRGWAVPSRREIAEAWADGVTTKDPEIVEYCAIPRGWCADEDCGGEDCWQSDDGGEYGCYIVRA